MDKVELDLERKKAGFEYLVALKRLGLQPDALFWAFDKSEQHFVLMLATEMFDFKGPLAVSELLFKAYNASATPKEIDPFVVRLHSPDHTVIRYLDGWKVSGPPGSEEYMAYGQEVHLTKPFAVLTTDYMNLQFQTDWVYRYKLPKRVKSVELMRQWNRFSRNVERIAA